MTSFHHVVCKQEQANIEQRLELLQTGEVREQARI